jgi:hypothetical protein
LLVGAPCLLACLLLASGTSGWLLASGQSDWLLAAFCFWAGLVCLCLPCFALELRSAFLLPCFALLLLLACLLAAHLGWLASTLSACLLCFWLLATASCLLPSCFLLSSFFLASYFFVIGYLTSGRDGSGWRQSPLALIGWLAGWDVARMPRAWCHMSLARQPDSSH